jgi:aminoacyl-tRNA hydrolase
MLGYSGPSAEEIDMKKSTHRMFKARTNALLVRLALIRTRTLDRVSPQISGMLRNGTLDLLVSVLAMYRRFVLGHTTFIGVTGSCGKTMTKELISAVLSSRFRGQKNRDSLNTLREVIRTILQVRTTDTYCVNEISVGRYFGRLTLGHRLKILRPTIGVVTNIGTDHLTMFGSRQSIAAEKRRLVAVLPEDGTAVLNADDPLVLEMARHCVGRVVTYGTGPDAVVRGTDAGSTWPDRLSFTVHFGDESRLVQTQLCGTLWMHSVLAALAAGLSLGIPLEAAIEAVKPVRPFPRRMSPEESSNGVMFIRDDWKAPILSFAPALEFMKQAKAPRKIVIIGSISDFPGSERPKYLQIAREARAASDYVFFVGPMASYCLRARTSAGDISLQAFATAHHLADYLRRFLQAGDLILLKGSPKDHMQSIVKMANSRGAPPLQDALDAQTISPATDTAGQTAEQGRTRATAAKSLQLVIGLGNPEKEYEGTRHNIGHRVVDTLAARLGARWEQQDQAMLARIDVAGRPVCFAKLLTSMNTSGVALRYLGAQLGVGAPECVLVYDDMDLPLGKVRDRMRGSAGGHRGVLSIIATYQSEDFRRVKIGVGQPTDKRRAAAFALSAFSPSEEAAIKHAVEEACSQVLRLLADHPSRFSSSTAQ